ncbi:hypothetical protein F2Q69_00051249 [Brassica cretica]|uniref:Uncharacterized protein n=1 Tax=Brassica cretica TaxID=69181 RepID=A0A8S9PME0_BRACR|nr:hypothetical protein F2Q69_00051249 [Brassica cretica]
MIGESSDTEVIVNKKNPSRVRAIAMVLDVVRGSTSGCRTTSSRRLYSSWCRRRWRRDDGGSCYNLYHVHVVEHPSYDKDDADMFVENSNAKDVDDNESYETDFSDRKFCLTS